MPKETSTTRVYWTETLVFYVDVVAESDEEALDKFYKREFKESLISIEDQFISEPTLVTPV